MAETSSSIVPEEVRQFAAQAGDWWDPDGSEAMLHKLNPVRLAYVRDMIHLAEKRGFAWSIWGYGGAFGVVEEFGGRPAEPDILDEETRAKELRPRGRKPLAERFYEGGWGKGIREWLSHWTQVIRGALIGIWAGVLPGVGATAGTWLAYGQAVATAKDKRKFGKGDPRGIVGPESANNSGCWSPWRLATAGRAISRA